MAFYKQAEFAEKIGKTRGWLNVYVKRGNIILSGDYIDDSIEKNQKFFNKWIKKKNEPKPEKKVVKTEPIPEPEKIVPEKLDGPKIGKPKIIEQKRKAPNIQEPEKIDLFDSPEDALDIQKKKAEIRFKNSQIEKNELQSAKLRGDSIPTNLVQGVISTLGRSFQSSYKNGAEVLLIELAHQLKMSVKVEAKFKGKLIELINKAHADAIKEAKTTVETIISDAAAVEAVSYTHLTLPTILRV